MAVYTEVPRESLERFLAQNYSLGQLLSFEGISDGIENTNYQVKTEKGLFILTLFEKRSPVEALPFFMDLTNHLANKGIPCPKPVLGHNGECVFQCESRPAALITFLAGASKPRPGPDDCFAMGQMNAGLHLAVPDFQQTRENPLGLSGLKTIFASIQNEMKSRLPDLWELAGSEFNFQESKNTPTLHQGVVHADLFPDNVFFEDGMITGVIDFYFAATDTFSYDLAVTVNSWCFSEEGKFLENNFFALLSGYESLRPLNFAEKKSLPSDLRRAALRFLMTRSEDWLNPPEGLMGVVKDPLQYGKILSFHQKRRHIEDYVKA